MKYIANSLSLVAVLIAMFFLPLAAQAQQEQPVAKTDQKQKTSSNNVQPMVQNKARASLSNRSRDIDLDASRIGIMTDAKNKYETVDNNYVSHLLLHMRANGYDTLIGWLLSLVALAATIYQLIKIKREIKRPDM